MRAARSRWGKADFCRGTFRAQIRQTTGCGPVFWFNHSWFNHLRPRIPETKLTTWREPAISRRRARPRLDRSSRPMRAQGRPGARCTRGLVCNGTTKCAHEHTGPAESIRPSLRNGLTAYGALSLETNSSCLHHRRIDSFANPVGLAKTSASLTPATGARTTRFCRTQLPSPTHPTSHLRPAEVLAEAFKRRSSTRCRSLTENRPANMPARPTLPRPSHPIPTFRDDRDTPLVQGDEVRELCG